jgi:O-antigen ligase
LKSVRYTAIFFALIFTALIQLTHSNTLTKGIQLVSQNLHAYQSGDKYSSVGLRLQFHNYAKSLFLAKPIAGHGTGGFGFRFRQDNPVPGWDLTHPDPHSQYWHTASELGLIGILLLLLLLGALYKLSFALQEMKPILQAVILPFCVVCFSDTVLLTSGIGYLFVTFTGLCLGELIALRQITQTEIIQPAVKRSEYGLE